MSDPYLPILETLSRSKRVLVTTHVRPDGDALGSTAAIILGLRAKGIDAEALLLSHLPTKYAFIFNENGIVHHDVETDWPDPFPFERFDCFLVVDTGTWSQLPGVKERIETWGAPKLVVDHHLTQESWGDHRLVVTTAAAAGEIVAELLERWGISLTSAMATCLFIAVASDTGWFQFSNTCPYTMRLAAGFMEAGVDTDRVYQLLYQNERAARIALQARALQSMELLADGRVAVLRLRKSDFEIAKANVPDSENLINLPLQIATVQVSIMCIEPADFGPVRISLRSKGQVDVAKFAEQFGGGGHARASGLKMNTSFDEAHDQVVAAMLKTLPAIEP
jgi:phosphoesterase RecJ-like protein